MDFPSADSRRPCFTLARASGFLQSHTSEAGTVQAAFCADVEGAHFVRFLWRLICSHSSSLLS